MTDTPFTKSVMDLLAHINLPAADLPHPADGSLADPMVPLAETLGGTAGLIDHLLAEVEEDLREGRIRAANTALGLVGTRIGLDATRGATPPKHVEWLAAHLRTAAQQLTEGHVRASLQAVRRARLALRP